jgi:nucleotide-binding universal stress UspA family protein
MATAASAQPIVVGTDGSPVSKVAVDWAARTASLRGVALKVVHVLNPPVVMAFPEVPMPEGYLQWQEEEGRRVLAAGLSIAEEAFLLLGDAAKPIEVTSEMVVGSSVPELVLESSRAQLVVVGCRGRSAVARGLLGSVSTGLVHHAHCPVAIIHDEDPLMPHPSKAPVVVGVDGSPASERAVAIGFEEASLRGVDLVAVHAWSDSGMFEFPGADWSELRTSAEVTLSERLAGWGERYPDVLVRRVVVADRPAHQLLEQAQSAQLLVVGSHGRGGFAGMVLGSVSTAVIHGARMPVIVAR